MLLSLATLEAAENSSFADGERIELRSAKRHKLNTFRLSLIHGHVEHDHVFQIVIGLQKNVADTWTIGHVNTGTLGHLTLSPLCGLFTL